MVVHLVAEAGLADLVEAFELVQAQRVAVGHDDAVEENGKPFLAEAVHLLDFPEHTGTLRDEEVLAVVGVDIGGHHAVDRAGEVGGQAVGENGLQERALEEPVQVAGGLA